MLKTEPGSIIISYTMYHRIMKQLIDTEVCPHCKKNIRNKYDNIMPEIVINKYVPEDILYLVEDNKGKAVITNIKGSEEDDE